MEFLGLTLLLVAFAHLASVDSVADKARSASQAVYPPYNYRPYGTDAYDYDVYDHTFGAYPSTFDLGVHRLHLSGGIYRPYGYDDAVYRPPDSTYGHYDYLARRYPYARRH